jgi:hypothetical protein
LSGLEGLPSITSKGENTNFAEKPELILLKIMSFFSDLLEKKLRI